MTSLRPALQHLAGEMLVEQGSVMPLLTSRKDVQTCLCVTRVMQA